MQLILLIVCCVLSALNLIFVLFLSNAIFRLFYREDSTRSDAESEPGGLVDVRDSPTYDPRFK